MMMKRRGAFLVLIGGGIAATCAIGRAPVAPLRMRASTAPAGAAQLPDFRRPGERDDSAAIRRALAAGHRNLYLPAGKGAGPNGDYLISMDAREDSGLPPGTQVRGDAGQTVVRPVRPSGSPIFDVLSRGPEQTVSGIRLEEMILRGWVSTHDFEEHAHLVRLNGVSDAVLRNLRIEGFQGDGVYLGSGLRQGDERHNLRVSIVGCHFDGITGNNRNAISVIDCDGLNIADSSARRVTRPGDGTPRAPATASQKRDRRFGLAMPGALTFEPDKIGDFTLLRNVAVTNWSVEDCGGSAVALNLRDNRGLRARQGPFTFTGVSAARCAKGISVFGYPGNSSLASVPSHSIAISDFQARETAIPVSLDGVVGLSLSGSATDSGTAMLGLAGGSNRDVKLRINFLRCGTADAPNPGVVIRINAATRGLDLTGSRFSDCGARAPSVTSRLIFFTNGEQRDFRVGDVVASEATLPINRAMLFSRAGGSNVTFTGFLDPQLKLIR